MYIERRKDDIKSIINSFVYNVLRGGFRKTSVFVWSYSAAYIITLTLHITVQFGGNTGYLSMQWQWLYRSQQSDVRWRWTCVKNAGPHEAAGKVDYGLDVLLVRFHIGGDKTLLFGDTPLLCLTVDGREPLVATRLLATLNEDKHVLPIGVDDSLEVKGQPTT